MANPLYDALTGSAASASEELLVIPDRETWTRTRFLAEAARFANALSELGVLPGERVAVQVTKSPQALALYLGTVQCGGVFLPMNTAYTPAEISYFVNDATPRVLVCDSSAMAALQKELADQVDDPGALPVIMTLDAGGGGTVSQLAANQSAEFRAVDRSSDDLAAILYTSGTTGRSKGAMLTHNNLLSNALTLKNYWEFTNSDVLLNALPIYHTHGLFTASNTLLLAGGKMVFPARFDAGQALEWLKDATAMMGVPTFYTRLLSESSFTAELVAHIRVFISGSAPLLAETHQAFEARTGKRILERYGMTETSMNSSNPYHGDRRAGTVGFALPDVELRICDPDTGDKCDAGDVGMIQVRGPNVFAGYWNMPEKTAEEMTEDGYFITGDLGKIDTDGYVHIVGRGKDLIISGGFNVYPKEIELLLDEQPGVLESAVVGAPHPDFGESVVALVVADGSCALDTNDLQESLSGQLARFKQPRRVVLIDELPRNAMGKVQKNVLREQVADSFQ